jgi:hypothetical protein
MNMMSVPSLDGIAQTLQGLNPDVLSAPLFIEMLSCPGGCINGPLSSTGEAGAVRRLNVLAYARNSCNTTREK